MDERLRPRRASALGKLGTRDDLPMIKKMLKDDDSHVRSVAVSALGKFGTHDDLL